MRIFATIVTSVVPFVMTVPGCTSGGDEPLFLETSTGGTMQPEDAGLDGETDAYIDASPAICMPDMGQTACDKCVYGQCCTKALACSTGTPCDALWTCARQAGCLGPPSSDFDTCAVSACPDTATEAAVAAIAALATCIQSNCGVPCGG
jgi:hypothetical protein